MSRDPSQPIRGQEAGAVNIVIKDSGEGNVSSLSAKDDFDHDTYVERDTLLEEAVMVETQTIKITQDETLSLKKNPRDGAEPPASAVTPGVSRHSVTRMTGDLRSELRSELRDLTSSSYDDVPLPPSPRLVSKYRKDLIFCKIVKSQFIHFNILSKSKCFFSYFLCTQ